MSSEQTRTVSFTQFVEAHERRLRQSLTAAFGSEIGKEAAAEALAYGWEHWDKVVETDNPGGYLYRVGYNLARRMKPRRVQLPTPAPETLPWVEPGLPAALASLSERARTVITLLHGFQWSMSEVADHLGVSKGTVQSYSDRALKKLRTKLGVNL
jgi:RNA polymerase sigma-70 factor (ECF subfamily)